MMLSSVVLALLFVIPSSFAGPCGCSGGQKELPKRNCGEDDTAYYKRVFVITKQSECGINKFYEDVFYEYKGESREEYVNRINFIFSKIYRHLDCREDNNRAQYLQKYYQYKYAKYTNESDETFFQRSLSSSSKSEHVIRSKLELLKRFFSHRNWNSVQIDTRSERGYTIKSASSAKHVCQGGQKKDEKKSVKKDNKHVKKHEQKKWEHVKKHEQKKWEHEANARKAEERKREHEANVRKIEVKRRDHEANARKAEEKKREHEANIRKAEEKKREHEANVRKIEEKKREHEANVRRAEEKKREHEANVRKIEERKREHEANVKKIEERKREHEANVRKIEERKREHEANVRKIEERKREHEANVKKIEERKRSHDENVRKIEERKKFHDENVRKIEERKKQREENVKKWIRANYKKQNDETIESYYKRICSNTFKTNEEYIERITQVRTSFNDLDLWYNSKYLSETRNYYTLVYSKKSDESLENYYKRLTTPEHYESPENFAKRVEVLHSLFPSLSLWSEEKYYQSYTKNVYSTYYKKSTTETNEHYLRKVFTKIDGESDSDFWRRIKLIKKTFPDYDCWQDRESLKTLHIFRSISEATNEAELRERVEAETKNSDYANFMIESLQSFFVSTTSSSKSISHLTKESNSANSEWVSSQKKSVRSESSASYARSHSSSLELSSHSENESCGCKNE